MWIFAPHGLLMPAAIPAAKVDPKYLGPDGDFDLQIRVRAISHLENFIRDYAEPLNLAHSEIQKTPEMDYNARIYMRKADFAVAVAHMVMDIDYKKFKPTAEDKNEDGTLRYREGKEYHSVLNAIWGTVCRLGRPGGSWGPYSATNPNGYRPGRWAGAAGYRDTAWGRAYRQPDRLVAQDDLPSYWDNDDVRAGELVWAAEPDDAYVPDSTDRRLNALYEVEDLPAADWPDWLSEQEMALVREEYLARLAEESPKKKSRRKSSRRASRASRAFKRKAR